ncbi:MAG: outer membrane beta-barrel protein [Fermentimonas sp.]|jgi:hypothetical protein
MRFFEKVLSLVLLLSSGLATISAQNISVIGRLISSGDKMALPYATITVFGDSDSKDVVKKFATDDKGQFKTDLSAGKYVFEFNYVGMEMRNINVDLFSSVNNKHDLGDIELAESSMELEEVSVTAQRPLVKVEIDKLTYSAQDDPEATTSNVLDMLRKVPLVTVDGDEQIQLKGSSSFKVYINGKPSNMLSSSPSQVLKSMPASNIKDIEVITDPGAKYDAEGVSGIINIVTEKRVDDGYSGSVGGNVDSHGGYGANAYLATKYGKFGFTGNAGYHNHKSPSAETSFIRDEFGTDVKNTLTQDGFSKNNTEHLIFNGSMSYEPDTLNLFNMSVSKFISDVTSSSDQNVVSGPARPYKYSSAANGSGEFGGINFSFDYQRSFKKKGEMLTGSYRFERNPNNNEYDMSYEVEPGGTFYLPDGYKTKSINDAGGDEHTFQIDYVNPLTDIHNIETGVKYIYRDNSSRTDNTFFDVNDKTWKPDLDKKNDLDHKQYITSAYAGYSLKKDKIGIKLGTRLEHTKQEIHFMTNESDDIVNTNFTDIVPSATISYQMGATNNLRAGYNMRISRPGIWYLNPYVNDFDPNNISYGNPNLESEQQHNININFGSFSQKLNINATINYSFTKNAITPYSFIAQQDMEDGTSTTVTHNTFDNIGKNHVVGTNVYVNWTPFDMLRTYFNGGIDYSDIKSNKNEELKNNGFSGRIFGGATITLPKDFLFMTNAGGFWSRVQLQTTQSPFYFYSFSVQKSFFEKKLDINLSANNIFSEFLDLTRTTTGEGFVQKSKTLMPVRSFGIRLTYRFGDLNSSVKRVQRSISNDDVMSGGDSDGDHGGGHSDGH